MCLAPLSKLRRGVVQNSCKQLKSSGRKIPCRPNVLKKSSSPEPAGSGCVGLEDLSTLNRTPQHSRNLNPEAAKAPKPFPPDIRTSPKPKTTPLYQSPQCGSLYPSNPPDPPNRKSGDPKPPSKPTLTPSKITFFETGLAFRVQDHLI